MIPHLWTIGDSWTDPRAFPWAAGQGWPQLVAAALEVGIVNSGSSGSGYVRSASSFPVQAAQGAGVGAAAVLVFGSLNDYLGTVPAADVRDAARTTYGLVRRLCPDADLIVVGPQWGATDPPALLLQHRDTVAAAAAEVGAWFVDASRWFVGRGSLMLDANHVTPAGHALVADRLGSAVASAVGAWAERQRRAYAAAP